MTSVVATGVATVSESLASFAAGLRPADLPAEVVARVKRHLLDVLGVALAAAGDDFAARARAAVATLASGTGAATLIGDPAHLPPASVSQPTTAALP